jgi:PAS domain-containing protein
MKRHLDTSPAAESLARRKRARIAGQAAARVTWWYAWAASLWILTSDWLITHLGLPRSAVDALGSAKGILFVAVTSAILYVASAGAARRIYDNEERYHRLFDNAPEGILLFRVVRGPDQGVADLLVADANRAQLELSGLTREEIVGCKMSEPCAATELLARGTVTVRGRMPWASNATFLAEREVVLLEIRVHEQLERA